MLASTTPLDLSVVAKRLDERRASITPAIGASHYDITQQAIQAQPHGEDTPFNQVVLRTPGVANDSYGQLHVRGEHANVQYRINGILLPGGLATFAPVLDTRMVSNASLLTGALPAQYGYRTSGVVDIQTKEGTLEPEGERRDLRRQRWLDPAELRDQRLLGKLQLLPYGYVPEN